MLFLLDEKLDKVKANTGLSLGRFKNGEHTQF